MTGGLTGVIAYDRDIVAVSLTWMSYFMAALGRRELEGQRHRKKHPRATKEKARPNGHRHADVAGQAPE